MLASLCYLLPLGDIVGMLSVDGKPVLTLAQAAERTARPVRVLRLWARQGRIPAIKLGREWLIAEADLAAIEAMPKRKRRKVE